MSVCRLGKESSPLRVLHLTALFQLPQVLFGLRLLAIASAILTMSGDAARDRMMGEIGQGGIGVNPSPSTAGASKTILARGCDPAMAQRAAQMLPPLLDGARMVGATTDDEFFRLLHSGAKYDAVFFAPGACRYNAAKAPIPGGNENTRGWSLNEYRAAVRKHLGADVPIVETTEEREIVPLLRKALNLH